MVWDRRSEFQIIESVQYYFNKIDVIKMPDYNPDKVRTYVHFLYVILHVILFLNIYCNTETFLCIEIIIFYVKQLNLIFHVCF